MTFRHYCSSGTKWRRAKPFNKRAKRILGTLCRNPGKSAFIFLQLCCSGECGAQFIYQLPKLTNKLKYYLTWVYGWIRTLQSTNILHLWVRPGEMSLKTMSHMIFWSKHSVKSYKERKTNLRIDKSCFIVVYMLRHWLQNRPTADWSNQQIR